MSLRKSALVFSLTAGAVGLLPVIAIAQDQPIVEVPTARNTAVGEVNARDVNVRSGPAESYYPTMKLNKGDRVTVVGHKFDWLKILPPEGSFSYIAKIYVDRDATGTSGTVNRDDVLVRAGSLLNQRTEIPQTKLATGTKVEIIGESNEFFRVKPPEGAYLFVSKKFVDLVANASTQPAAGGTIAAGAAAGAGAVAVGAAQGTSTDVVPVEQPKPRRTEARSTETDTAEPKLREENINHDQETEFRKLERQFEQSKELPLDQQPIAQMLTGYQGLQDSQNVSSTTRRMAAYRVQYLTAMKTRQDELLKAKQEQADFAARQAQVDAEQKQMEEKMKAAGIAVYTAVGSLQTSAIEKDGLKLMRLVDPGDNRTLVYVRLSDTKQRGMVGKFVGVRGEVIADSTLGVDIIEPTEVEQVDPARVLKGVSAKIYPPSIVRGSTTQPQ